MVNVSLEKRLCVICGEEYRTGRVLRSTCQPLPITSLTGLGTCPECRRKLRRHVALVEVHNDEKVAGRMVKSRANRTGRLIWLQHAEFQSIFGHPPPEAVIFLNAATFSKIVVYPTGSSPKRRSS